MLGSKFVKFLMSNLNWQVNSSSNFASFLIFMTHKSPSNSKLIHFLLWIKVSHWNLNIETFECSGENLANSLCHFWKQKSVGLQILYLSSVPSSITPLYFFSLNIMYFGQKQSIKGYMFEIFECAGQNLPNSSIIQYGGIGTFPLP